VKNLIVLLEQANRRTILVLYFIFVPVAFDGFMEETCSTFLTIKYVQLPDRLSVHWLHLANSGVHCWSLVISVMNVHCLSNRGLS
jgi:hypothetical protein